MKRIFERLARFAEIYIEHAEKFEKMDRNDSFWRGYHLGQTNMAEHLKQVLWEEQGIKLKGCPKCGRILPEFLFGKCPENADGLTYYCNECRAKFGDVKREK